MSLSDLRRDLAAESDELRETHISLVFLAGGVVYKVKKPVDFGFLDFTTIEKRRTACDAEVELNRRLAPDVYRGVVPVTRGPDGVHRIDGDGELVDWAVHMRRLPDEARADVLLERGDLGVPEIDRVAEHVARFHASAREDEETRTYGEPDAIRANVVENFEQTRSTIGEHLRADEAREIERWQLGFLDQRADVLRDRVRRGRIRDGHGDLRLEHVYLERDEIRVIDCIEFNDRFRYADVCADLAFLSMDLAWHGRVDLAERLLATYARVSNDYDLYAVVDFYESYRAFVRAKVKSMAGGEHVGEDARRYYRLALAAERPPLVPPMVIAVGGILASGKSTLSDRLSLATGGPAINTDWVRKLMAGATPTTKLYEEAWKGAYSLDFTEKVYAEVMRFAGVVVRSKRPVVLDASFRDAKMRARARELAASLGVPFRFVECRCDPGVARERLRRRAIEGSVSDGRLEIFDDFLAKWEPVTELDETEHLVVDTESSLDDNVAHLRATLPTWPSGGAP